MFHGWAIIRENQRKILPLFEASHARFCLMSFFVTRFFVEILWNFAPIILWVYIIWYVYVFLLMTILLKYPKKCARQRQSRHTRKFSISPQPPARLVLVATRPCSSGKSSSTLEGDGKWEKDLESARVILIPSTEWELPLSKNENNLLFEPRHGEIMSKCCSTISSSSWNVLLNILQLRNLRLCLDKWRTGVESTWRTGRAHSSQFFILISAGDNTCTKSVCAGAFSEQEAAYKCLNNKTSRHAETCPRA